MELTLPGTLRRPLQPVEVHGRRLDARGTYEVGNLRPVAILVDVEDQPLADHAEEHVERGRERPLFYDHRGLKANGDIAALVVE